MSAETAGWERREGEGLEDRLARLRAVDMAGLGLHAQILLTNFMQYARDSIRQEREEARQRDAFIATPEGPPQDGASGAEGPTPLEQAQALVARLTD